MARISACVRALWGSGLWCVVVHRLGSAVSLRDILFVIFGCV